jgi:hypothetical protein
MMELLIKLAIVMWIAGMVVSISCQLWLAKSLTK